MYHFSLTGKNEKGFTLIEMMVVSAIIAILAAIAIPAFSTWYPNIKLKSAVTDLFSNMQLAKMEAIKSKTDCFITFNPSSNKYTRSWDSAEIKLGDYGKSIVFGNGNATEDVPGDAFPSDFVSYSGNKVTFNSRGMMEGVGGYAYLTNSKGTAYAIGSLSSGVIFLRKWTGSDWE